MVDKIESGSDAEKLEPNERREFLKNALKWTGGAIAAGISTKVLGISEALASDSTEQDIIDDLRSGKEVFKDNETLIKYMENKGLSQEIQEKLILELCYEVTPEQKKFLEKVRSRKEYFESNGLDRTYLFKYMIKIGFPKEIVSPFCNEIFPIKYEGKTVLTMRELLKLRAEKQKKLNKK